MSKIAIFGGSFDPIHLGHLDVITHILEHDTYDELWIIPCKLSPGKSAPVLDDHTRLTILKEQFRNWEKVRVTDIELNGPEPSYTITTIETFLEQFPKHAFDLWMGMDQFKQLESWHRAKELVSKVGIAVFNRDSSLSMSDLRACHADTQFKFKELSLKPVKARALSSTEIRTRLGSDQSVQGLVPRKALAPLRSAYPNTQMSTVIGVTGRAGSGKSTHAKQLSQEQNAPIINLDAIGHEALADTKIKQELLDHFSAQILDEKQQIDRRELGAIVFNDPKELATLNSIVHPYITAQTIRRILEATETLIVEGALIEELGLLDYCDTYIVMDTPDETAMARNPRDISAILASQRSRESFLKHADQIVRT